MIIVLTYAVQFVLFGLSLECGRRSWEAFAEGAALSGLLWIAALLLCGLGARETGRLRDWLAERDRLGPHGSRG